MKDLPGVVAICIFGMLAGFSVRVISDKVEISTLKTEAIRRGFAEWSVEQETGGTTFTWKEKP